MDIFKIHKVYLLLLLSAVWGLAGFNVLKVGIPELLENAKDYLLVCLTISFAIFVSFMLMFYRVVTKHRKRIMSYDKKIHFFKLMDLKGYIFVGCMMILGIVLRGIELIPRVFIGTFYIGLGFALSISALIIVSFFIIELKYKIVNNSNT